MKFLVVEDEKKTGSYLRKGLLESGFTVDIADEGEDGLHLARTGDYDLIIFDVMLPRRDGWSVLAELRRGGKQVPVLFLTARDTVEDRVKGLEAGVEFVRGLRLSRMRNINLLPPGPIFGPRRVDPQFADIYQLEDSASSTYQGVSFVLNRRMSNELEFSVNYTLSKTFDNASDFNEQPQNPFDLKRSAGIAHRR